jgi:hypothetical protein
MKKVFFLTAFCNHINYKSTTNSQERMNGIGYRCYYSEYPEL